ncbi:MAG TPA: BREX system P-loop protein BrxC [Chloroflexota bacterium]|nr:BREX system P-loop protein BrxC [Chloroflexota bacterium]
MKNREIFVRDPVTKGIPNDGDAKVIEPRTPQEWEVLRFELESFVCDGEYQRGLERIIATFLDHLAKPQQPAVWVNGFYGSGKSHLVRVLEHLWRDVAFPDGVRARSLVRLPAELDALFKELTRVGKQAGGLWSAAGTLAAGTNAIRPTLLSILFRSAGLPEQYPAARLVLWLKTEGYLDAVEASVQKRGKTLENDLRNMYVSPVLADALLEAVPGLAASATEVHALLRAQYPPVSDITDDELRHTMAEVLSLQSDTSGKVPLTLLVFDELQQFIANDPTRTLQVQNVVEACTAQFGSQILFVATGQSALQSTTELQKLQGRFTVRVSLSDTDVEKVVREVVLRKAPEKVSAVRNLLDLASGEIDRQLAGTRIGRQASDGSDRVSDYPLLPVRRRFWERVLRAIDSAGTAGQLRTQLQIVYESTRDVAEQILGTVIPADAIFWKLETVMTQNTILDRDLATMIHGLNQGGSDGLLRMRLAALIFLISKLPTEGPAATGIRSTAELLADLLVDDLTTPSADLRQRVPVLLEELVQRGTLMLVGDEYGLQTPESAEWDRAFRDRYAKLFADDVRLASDRSAALKTAIGQALKGLNLIQGASKVARKYELHFGSEAPMANSGGVPIWIRDGWSVSEKTVREEAQAAGVQSPILYVFLPRFEADDLKQSLASQVAADETIKTQPDPQTQGGRDARAAMVSRVDIEQRKVNTSVDKIIKSGRIYQGGGNELVGNGFAAVIKDGVDASLVRLYREFSAADQAGWDKVVSRATDGAADALSALGYGAEIDKHPVCQAVRTFVGGAGKKGSEIQRHFQASPYGWSKDAIDGALLVLLAGGFFRASQNGQPIHAKGLTRPQIGGIDFLSEGITISAPQRIDLRNLAAGMGLTVKPGEEAGGVARILDRLVDLARSAGGNPPLPARPDDAPIRTLQALGGNAQLAAVHEQRAQLLAWSKGWSNLGESIRRREPEWNRLSALLDFARDLPIAAAVEPSVEAIKANHALLDDPDPAAPVMAQLASALRAALREAHDRLKGLRDGEVGTLEASADWSQIGQIDRTQIRTTNGLQPVPPLDLGSDESLLAALTTAPLREWEDRIIALPARVAKAREQVAKLLEPTAVSVRLPGATVRNVPELEKYLEQLHSKLLPYAEAGTPVVII